jgi:hypothetical protein
MAQPMQIAAKAQEGGISGQPAGVKQEEIYCHGAKKGGCQWGNEISPQIRDYSMRMYGKILCAKCQQDSTPIKK